jgi:hypothetical protein
MMAVMLVLFTAVQFAALMRLTVKFSRLRNPSRIMQSTSRLDIPVSR